MCSYLQCEGGIFMTGFFNPNNKLWSALSTAVDAVLLNLMWLISCIPLFTVGAATTAFYYTTHKVIRNQKSGIWKEYWSSFRSNFKQATKLWLLFFVIFLVFSFDIRICMAYLKTGTFVGMLAYFFIALAAMALVWFMYVFAYLARFENGCKATLKNAVFLELRHLPWSLLLIVLLGVAAFAVWLIWPLIFLVPALLCMLFDGILERIFRKYMSEEDLARELEIEAMDKLENSK